MDQGFDLVILVDTDFCMVDLGLQKLKKRLNFTELRGKPLCNLDVNLF